MIQILVVDDTVALLEAIKCVLETNPGFQVDIAISAIEAFGFLNDNNYDIIISDYSMPEMNGIDFLKLLRSRHCTIPFILQTGQGDERTAMEALENGADFFLEKGGEGPLQFLAFTQVINLLVSHQRGQNRLEKSLGKYRALYETMDTGLVFIDETGLVQDVNPAFLEMTGYSADEIRDLTYHQLIPGTRETFSPDSLRSQVMNRGISDEYALEYVHRNGEVIPVAIRAASAGYPRKSSGIWFFVRRRG